MSETKFTPGPWGKDETAPYYISAEDGRNIATVHSGLFTNQEAKANADLTAAAPDLYYALSGCADMLTEAAKQFRQRGDTGHATLCLMHAGKANAALAKARGEKTDEQ